ncbi:MAG: signal peptidase I [Clostridia bacterium]|nr:signal peptidase I [Clostridia bacterium]
MENKKTKKTGTILIVVLASLLFLFVGIRTYFIDWYTVSGGSMLPTYTEGQIVFAHKVGNADRFDVVIIEGETLVGQDLIIKRIVAFEGEEVWTEKGVLFVCSNGVTTSYANEEYGKGQVGLVPKEIKRQTVPQGHVFVLGDNRQDSIDSRTFGAVPVDMIEAIVF